MCVEHVESDKMSKEPGNQGGGAVAPKMAPLGRPEGVGVCIPGKAAPGGGNQQVKGLAHGKGCVSPDTTEEIWRSSG